MLRIDLSTIALILSLVVPGLIAKKSQRKLCAQSFEATGPTTELGQLVATSLVVHLSLLGLLSLTALLLGLLKARSALLYFQFADRFDFSAWEQGHKSESVLAAAFYLCLSMATGYSLGLVSGWLKLKHPVLRLIESAPLLMGWLKWFGVFAVLEERPLSFEVFSGEAVSRKTDLIYFLEIQLREDKGFITGKLAKYAIVKDEESHRPVVLTDAQFKMTAGDSYTPMEGDRVLIDLADALLVQVSYHSLAVEEMEDDSASA